MASWWEVSAENHGYWGKRMQIEKIIDDMRIAWNSEASVVDIYNAIVEYTQLTHTRPVRHAWTLRADDNVLLVDGTALKRVGPKPSRVYGYSPMAEFYEDLILAEQEQWMD